MLAVVGCSGRVEDTADASDGATRGLVSVERTTVVSATESTTRTNVSAKFMRVSPSADVALADRVVGSTLELPAAGHCASLGEGAAAESVPSALTTTSIDLLDVGDVSLDTGGTESTMALAARAFPDLGDLVSGVFYTSRDAASELPAPGRYILKGSGSAALDRFTVEADAPTAPEDVRIGEALLSEGANLEEGAPVLVRWARVAVDARRDDLVVVEVTSPRGTGVRCSLHDVGEGVVPAGLVRATELGLGAEHRASVTVHRVRRESFAVSGLDAGEIRFDLAVTGRAVVVPRSQP